MQPLKRISQHMPHNQQGLTLIELMLSLSIGLIVSASAFELFTHSIRSRQIQMSVAEVQDAALFSLASVNQQIAHANLGAATPMQQQTAWTGVVFTGSIKSGLNNESGQPLLSGNLRGIQGVDAQLLTRSSVGPSNVTDAKLSDQLTIQYQAPFDGFDCEGDALKQGDMVIERFFTRTDRQRAANETKDLAIVLACDAGRYQLPDGLDADALTSNQISLVGFGDNGVIVMNRVDYLNVKLGVMLANGLAYMPIDTYLTTAASSNASLSYVYQAPIVAIQIGVVSRGNSALVASDSSQSRFVINGSERIIKQQTPSYIRRSLNSVVYLRNNQLRSSQLKSSQVVNSQLSKSQGTR
ncbi:PilW family protein [Psychrobacter sp. FDAARGOS_221]|uniref:PilW family protein n=1 Tax=Psychrobacter sp. FDAARGOS_221 TaxID=1975705 RepID=UPI000BB59E10|nr:prepilin-type N-terminal cleavage/methylation domain-containing protein [Psychrobacter sp. FDAARGOS_221]PNK61134.1 prepilin-type N-terminal cleavage/methylation domain-containing protein [Psychrobacter sp. FDAARGOS_221]